MIKNLPAMWEIWVQSLGREDPLKKGMATHSSILAWEILQTEEPGGLHTVHGILQAKILEWVAFPSSGNLPDPGIEPRSPTLQADSLPSEPPGKPSLKIAPIFLLIRGVFLQINFCWHIADLLCCVSCFIAK